MEINQFCSENFPLILLYNQLLIVMKYLPLHLQQKSNNLIFYYRQSMQENKMIPSVSKVDLLYYLKDSAFRFILFFIKYYLNKTKIILKNYFQNLVGRMISYKNSAESQVITWISLTLITRNTYFCQKWVNHERIFFW